MSDPAATRPSPIEGVSVLVVEDESMIALLIEDMLTELGCSQVWHASAVAEAMALLDQHRPDIVMLDVNLNREMAFPVAERLQSEGTPFVFASGYGGPRLPPAIEGKPFLHKPFSVEALRVVLGEELLRSRAATGLRRA
jgi:CheY-like chemotaxis protein